MLIAGLGRSVRAGEGGTEGAVGQGGAEAGSVTGPCASVGGTDGATGQGGIESTAGGVDAEAGGTVLGTSGHDEMVASAGGKGLVRVAVGESKEKLPSASTAASVVSSPSPSSTCGGSVGRSCSGTLSVASGVP
jgi:hypothetical protein